MLFLLQLAAVISLYAGAGGVVGLTIVQCAVGLPAAGTVVVRQGVCAVQVNGWPLGRGSGGVSPTENTAVTPLPGDITGGTVGGR